MQASSLPTITLARLTDTHHASRIAGTTRYRTEWQRSQA